MFPGCFLKFTITFQELELSPEEIWYENITDVMEQTILLVMIFGRWLMPKGKLTRDELSQLLLINMASAADIIEFFDIININAVSYDKKMITYVLVLWSWSLLQFPLNTAVAFDKLISGDEPKAKPSQTPTIARLSSLPSYIVKRMSLNIYEREFESEDHVKPAFGEFASITVGLLLQDAPYLVMRLFIISYYKTFGYMIVFLTVKNGLFFILEVYRLCVLFCHCKDSYDHDPSPDSRVQIQGRFSNIQIAIPHALLNNKISPMQEKNKKASLGTMSSQISLYDET